MSTIFLVAAAFGGAVLLLQLLLGLIGLGGGHDISVAHDLGAHDGIVDDGLQLLTVRGVAAALTFFGIGGMAMLAAGTGNVIASLVGVAAGTAVAFAVAVVMRQLGRLESDGVIRMEAAIGLPAVVHVGLPDGGAGKVILTLQDRLLELKAVSLDGDIPTGTNVTVVGLTDDDTLEVVRTPEPGA